MKIYTSYHGNFRKLIEAGLQPINISVQHPKFIADLYPDYFKLAPTYQMLRMSPVNYDHHFSNILSAQNQHKAVKDLESLSGGKDVAICCYEKPGDRCHRHNVAEWLNKAGYSVEEYREKPKPKPVQFALF